MFTINDPFKKNTRNLNRVHNKLSGRELSNTYK